MSLQYEITSWMQIGECLSNTDRHLHAFCKQITDDTLQGLVVGVNHDKFGCLFSYLVQGQGSLISHLSVAPMSTKDILEQFKRFGFYIVFKEEKHLSGKLVEYLITLDKLDYDKIRILYVDCPPPMIGQDDIAKYYVVAFKVTAHPKWIDNTYRATEEEITEGTMNGTVINVSAISAEQKFRWNFLGDYVLNISDIIEANSTPRGVE